MLTKTSQSAVKALVFMVLEGSAEPVSPRQMADSIGESPSYMAKITQMLVKAGILRAYRGVSGGVTLLRDPKLVTLLDIVEACQGKILGNYCRDSDGMEEVCGYHQAMLELHQETTSVLSRWTLAELAARPAISSSFCEETSCHMAHVCEKVKV